MTSNEIIELAKELANALEKKSDYYFDVTGNKKEGLRTLELACHIDKWIERQEEKIRMDSIEEFEFDLMLEDM